VPFFSVFGAEPSAIIELAPPPDVSELLPGDFLEAQLEYIILPAVAHDYYGPDEGFRTALNAGANTWRLVHREAALSAGLKANVAIGQLKSTFPLEVAANGDRAEFSLSGPPGYLPVTISGLKGRRNPLLQLLGADGKWQTIDLSAKGNDYWQTDYDTATGAWACTYTVPPEFLSNVPSPYRLRFQFGGEAVRQRP
jgi:hypothetical protein